MIYYRNNEEFQMFLFYLQLIPMSLFFKITNLLDEVTTAAGVNTDVFNK